ncbi:MAG: hypothetical protein GU354_00215 [Caldimicrobium sp.]|jgi:hypothetical protein|nr:hypothetical protein [Caldimicrobium sp.]
MVVKQPLSSAEKPAVILILTKYEKVLRFKSAYYTFCVITLYAVGVSTKKFFSFWEVFMVHTIHFKAFLG